MSVEAKDTLTRYEPFMDKWMESVPMNSYPQAYKGRLHTLRYVFHQLAQKPKRLIVVELGTSRSFVDGAYPGCNSDDVKYWNADDPTRWDFGAGLFTYLCGEFLSTNHLNYEQYTVDLSPEHIQRCQVMTRPFASRLTYRVSDSVNFLNTFGTKCDLIYLDTGDMTPIEPTARLQLAEAQAIVRHRLLEPGGFILIDDVRNPTALKQGDGNPLGKAKYSVPYLLSQGFRIVKDEYQMVLTRP